MELSPDILLQKRLRKLALYFLYSVIGISVLIFLLRFTGSDAVYSNSPLRYFSMNPLTSFCFIALSLIVLLRGYMSGSRPAATIATVFYISVLVLVLIKVYVIISETDIAFDKADILHINGPQQQNLRGMAPNTVFCFMLLLVSLFFYRFNTWAARVFSQVALIFTLGIALFSMLGYFFGASAFYEIQKNVPMSFSATSCFFLLALSILFVNPSTGVMQQLTSMYSGSFMAWRLFIPAILLPVFIAALRLWGQRSGLYDLEFGSALFVTSMIFVFMSLIWINTLLLNRRENRQDEILKEKNYLANLVEQTSDAILSTDPYFNIKSWNKGAEDIYGFSKEEVVGKPLGSFLRGTLDPEVTKRLLNELNEKGFYTAEYEFYGKHEHMVYVQASVTVLRNQQNQITGYVAVHRNISERKKLEQQLRDFNSELEIQVKEKTQELRDVFERISEAFLGIGNDGRIVYANKRAEQLFGTGERSLINESIFDLFPQKDGETETAIAEALKTREYIYLETLLPRFVKWFEFHIYPSASGLSVYMRDITMRKQALRALHASEEKYRMFFENSMDGILITNAQGLIFAANKAACEIFGMTEEEICKAGREGILDESDPNWKQFYEEREKNGKAQGELRHFRKDGTVFPAEITSVTFKTAGGEVQTNTIVRDITERKKAQQRLQKEKDLSDSIINSLPGIFYFYDHTGMFIRWNKKFEEVSEYSGEEIAGMHPLDFFDGDDKLYLQVRIGEVFTKGVSDAEAGFVTKSGKQIPYFFTGARIEVNDIPCLIGMGVDITDRKRTEAEIQDSYQQIRRLTAHLQNIREEERAHIAREIHDELGQQLTVMKMDIAWIRKKINAGDLLAADGKMTEMLEILDGTVASVRRIATELRPSLLDDIGLIAAIEWQVDVFAKRTGIKVNLVKGNETLAVPNEHATGLFRILQESLTNITRHANADQVNIHLKNTNKEFILYIEDNGNGFDVKEVTGKKTLGLLGMRERSIAMDGTFTIESNSKTGTKTEVRVPLKTELLTP